MSGFSETIKCSECGGENFEHSVDNDDVSGICLDCGYEYHTVESQLSLDEVNELRPDYGLIPLTELREMKRHPTEFR